MSTVDTRLINCSSQPQIEENFERTLAIIDANKTAAENALTAKVGFGTAVNAVAANGTLTIATNPTADDTMTIREKVYTFKATAEADGDIAIGLDAVATQANIKEAINGNGEGQVCTEHPDVNCGDFAVNVATITAKAKGAAGNSIATTETFVAEGNVFSAEALAGGINGTVGLKGDILVDANKIYVATDINTVADANWKYASLT